MNARADASDDAIPVQVAGQHLQLPAGCTLAQLIERLGHAPQDVATAVNGGFVPRDARAGHRLQPGDQVHCFKPIVGG
ncbi:sulfur carrier protein ThiS [Aquincola sp. J276]|uniref:sulfur carrier protein ThiS n=1 Tax=Aquincola sp. J276 TaxID=2898432 RepID=UPI002151ADB4|nr:sulfur carrier protein ThiS [Aquincola sp. J276]MCR5865201.1 sulfur carrier protein ThiS [Aquincola sp. J276]